MNTPEKWETVAMIHPDSERAAWWLEIFGGDRAPIKSIIPHRTNLPGKPDVLVYEMDLKALTPDMRARLVGSIAKRFELDSAVVEANLNREGCPVLAEAVMVSTTNMGLFLPDAEIDDAWGWPSAGLSDLEDEENPDDWEEDERLAMFEEGDDPDYDDVYEEFGDPEEGLEER